MLTTVRKLPRLYILLIGLFFWSYNEVTVLKIIFFLLTSAIPAQFSFKSWSYQVPAQAYVPGLPRRT